MDGKLELEIRTGTRVGECEDRPSVLVDSRGDSGGKVPVCVNPVSVIIKIKRIHFFSKQTWACNIRNADELALSPGNGK